VIPIPAASAKRRVEKRVAAERVDERLAREIEIHPSCSRIRHKSGRERPNNLRGRAPMTAAPSNWRARL